MRPQRQTEMISVTLLLAAACVGYGWVPLAQLLAKQAGNSGWASVVLATIIGFGFLTAVLLEGLRTRSSLLTLAMSVLGSFWGRVLHFPTVVGLLMALAWTGYGSAQMIKATFSKGQSVELILGLLLLTAVYQCLLGIETILYLNTVLFTIGQLIMVLICFAVWYQYDFGYLMPVLGSLMVNAQGVVSGSVLILAFFSQAVVLYWILPFVRLKGPKTWVIPTFLGISLISLLGVALGSVAMLGPLLPETVFPVMLAARSWTISSFVERLDFPVIFGWLATLPTGMAILLWAATSSLQETFGMRRYPDARLLVLIPLVILVLAWRLRPVVTDVRLWELDGAWLRIALLAGPAMITTLLVFVRRRLT